MTVPKSRNAPQFSVTITNKSDRSIRVLDVRNGRPNDLQELLELSIIEGSRLVDLPIAVSDLGRRRMTALCGGGRRVIRPGRYLAASTVDGVD